MLNLRRKLYHTICFTSILGLVFGLAFVLWPNQEPQGQILTPKGLTSKTYLLPLTLELADEPAEQAKGLSEREFMPLDHGMLFVFPTSNKPGFWMKDMRFSLDLVWLDVDKVIVQIDEDVKPESYPDTIFRATTAVKYVIEINAGVVKKLDLSVGQKLNFSGSLE